MNKIWLATLLLPFTGFAQNTSDFDYPEGLFVLEEQQAVAEEVNTDVAYVEEQVTATTQPVQTKKPAYCAYCGAALVQHEEGKKEESVAVVSSAESSQAQVRPSPEKKQGMTPGSAPATTHLPKRLDSQDRPRVTQRVEVPSTQQNKGEISQKAQSASSEQRASTAPVKSPQSVAKKAPVVQQPQEQVVSRPEPQSEKSQRPQAKKAQEVEKSARVQPLSPKLKPSKRAVSQEKPSSPAVAQINQEESSERSAPSVQPRAFRGSKGTNRPQATLRQEQGVTDKAVSAKQGKSQRFSDEKIVKKEKKNRPCSSCHKKKYEGDKRVSKAKQKTKASKAPVARKAYRHSSKDYIRESMSYRTSDQADSE